jgi:two-component system, chemotaxis family, protein-glutamate methylesterase/glutaminase
MQSVAEVFRSSSMGIIMTGMGSNGLDGMRAIARESGMTFSQDKASQLHGLWNATGLRRE